MSEPLHVMRNDEVTRREFDFRKPVELPQKGLLTANAEWLLSSRFRSQKVFARQKCVSSVQKKYGVVASFGFLFYDIFNARGAAHKHVVYGRRWSFQTESTVRPLR
jgi:hypothetical protein